MITTRQDVQKLRAGDRVRIEGTALEAYQEYDLVRTLLEMEKREYKVFHGDAVKIIVVQR